MTAADSAQDLRGHTEGPGKMTLRRGGKKLAVGAGAGEGTELAARGTPARGPNAPAQPADRRPSRDRANWIAAQRILRATNAITWSQPSPQAFPPPAGAGGTEGQEQTTVRV